MKHIEMVADLANRRSLSPPCSVSPRAGGHFREPRHPIQSQRSKPMGSANAVIVITHCAIRELIWRKDRQIDEQTLAHTVEMAPPPA